MRIPTIHLNGTGYDTLRDEYFSAYAIVNQALDQVRCVTCHGRDYYVQGSTAASEAFEEHCNRLRALEKVKDELEKIVMDLDKQQLERR